MQDIIFLIRDARAKHYPDRINSYVQICFRRTVSSVQMLESSNNRKRESPRAIFTHSV